MIPSELAEQIRDEVKSLKEGQDRFLQTYKRLCVHFGGPEWQRKDVETVFRLVKQRDFPAYACRVEVWQRRRSDVVGR